MTEEEDKALNRLAIVVVAILGLALAATTWLALTGGTV